MKLQKLKTYQQMEDLRQCFYCNQNCSAVMQIEGESDNKYRFQYDTVYPGKNPPTFRRNLCVEECRLGSPLKITIQCLKLFFLICIVGGGVQTGSSRHVGHLLAYCTCPGWLWGWRILWNEWQGKPKYSEKTCPDATLSTTNPTWPDPGLNPGRRGRKPATNRFSYGAACLKLIWKDTVLWDVMTCSLLFINVLYQPRIEPFSTLRKEAASYENTNA
jgi:hypothetical protein